MLADILQEFERLERELSAGPQDKATARLPWNYSSLWPDYLSDLAETLKSKKEPKIRREDVDDGNEEEKNKQQEKYYQAEEQGKEEKQKDDETEKKKLRDQSLNSYLYVGGVTIIKVPRYQLPDGVLGMAFPGLGLVYIRSDLYGEEFQEVRMHELNHIRNPHLPEWEIRSMTKAMLPFSPHFH